MNQILIFVSFKAKILIFFSREFFYFKIDGHRDKEQKNIKART